MFKKKALFKPEISQISAATESAKSAKSAVENLRVTPASNPPSLFLAKNGTPPGNRFTEKEILGEKTGAGDYGSEKERSILRRTAKSAPMEIPHFQK